MCTCIVFFWGFLEENTIKVSLLQITVLFFPMSNVHMYCIFCWVSRGKYNTSIIFYYENDTNIF